MKIIKINVNGGTKQKEISVEVLVNEEFINTFGEKIHFFLKNSYQGSQVSPVEIAKTNRGVESSKL